MSKISGLQLVKPKFNWDTCNKLTEIEQFKADCRILFDGPLPDLRDKEKSGLIVNWLGRDAIQILTSVDVEISSTKEVFEALEKMFRLESNQTLACFKFRNMKQKESQTCDSYMSQLRLALPECKYKNDADELLKDQFIFGIDNKEIQDHLLGEISETDNSVKALYESKLAQRKLLGIVNPANLVSINAIRKNSQYGDKCDYCGHKHKRGKQNCPAFGKTCNKCSGRNHFKAMSRSSEGSRHKHEFERKRSDVHEINEECQNDTSMEDLANQVQSLFYH